MNAAAPFTCNPYPGLPYMAKRRRVSWSGMLPVIGLILLFGTLKWSGAL